MASRPVSVEPAAAEAFQNRLRRQAAIISGPQAGDLTEGPTFRDAADKFAPEYGT